MPEDGEDSDAILQDIAFLARSIHRITVLEALTEDSYDTRTLREETDTSKPTLSRILTEFEDRSWARRTVEGEYETTEKAAHVLAQFETFRASMRAIKDLDDDVGILPVDELTLGPAGEITLGLHHFAEANVHRQSPVAQGVGREELIESFRETATIQVLTDMAPPRAVGEVLQTRADRDDLSSVHVWTTELFEHLRNQPDHAPTWLDLMATGSSVYHLNGPIPANICVVDGQTFVWGASGEMRHRVLISPTPAVREWALSVIDRYRDRATEISPTDFN